MPAARMSASFCRRTACWSWEMSVGMSLIETEPNTVAVRLNGSKRKVERSRRPLAAQGARPTKATTLTCKHLSALHPRLQDTRFLDVVFLAGQQITINDDEVRAFSRFNRANL